MYISLVSVCVHVCLHMHLEGASVWICLDLGPEGLIHEAMRSCYYVPLNNHDNIYIYMWQTQVIVVMNPFFGGMTTDSHQIGNMETTLEDVVD